MTIKGTNFDNAINTQNWDILASQFRSSGSFDPVIQCLAAVIDHCDDSAEARDRAWQVFSRVPLEESTEYSQVAITHLVAHSRLFTTDDKQLLKWFTEACQRAPHQALFMACHLPRLLDAEDEQGQNALLPAIRSGQPAIVQKLIEKAPSLLRKRDAYGFSALHYAFESYQWGLIPSLIEGGAPLDQPSNLGTLLSSGPIRVRELQWLQNLIREFSNPDGDLENPCIGTLLLYTVLSRGTPEEMTEETLSTLRGKIFSGLASSNDKVDEYDWGKIFCIAANFQHVPVLAQMSAMGLFDRFVDAEAILCQTWDPLILDWYLNSFDVAKRPEGTVSPLSYLWKPKADIPDLKKRRRNTLKRLLNAGIDPSGVDANGVPIVHLAAEFGTWREVRMLRSFGASIDGFDKDGSNIFHHANRNPSTFFKLLNRGISPLQLNQRQEHPLAALKDPSLDPLPWVKQLVETPPETLEELCQGSSFLKDTPDNELIWESPFVVSALLCLPDKREMVLKHLVDLIPSDPLDPVQQVVHFKWLAPLFDQLFSPEKQLEILNKSSPLAFAELLRFASPSQRKSLKPALLQGAQNALEQLNLAYLSLDIDELTRQPERKLFSELRNRVLNLRRQIKSFLDQKDLLDDSGVIKTLDWVHQNLSEKLNQVLAVEPRIPANQKEPAPNEVDIMQGLVRLFPDGQFTADHALGSRLMKVYNVGLVSLRDLHVLGLAQEDSLPEDLRRAQQETLRKYLDQAGLEDFWENAQEESLDELQQRHPNWQDKDFLTLRTLGS